MILPISEAPFDRPLVLEHASDPQLSKRLGQLGINRGDTLNRLSQEALACSVRVQTPAGEVVLAPGMATKVIVHHDDGHKTPVSEMEPEETGHVEGLVCGSSLEKALNTLGIRENDRIMMLRRLPAMDYVALKEGKRLIFTEGETAKIWGDCRGRRMQFAAAVKDVPFRVSEILGGRRAISVLEAKGVVPRIILRLESVRPAPAAGESCSIRPGTRNLGVIQTSSGLRLYLRPDHEAGLMVRT